MLGQQIDIHGVTKVSLEKYESTSNTPERYTITIKQSDGKEIDITVWGTNDSDIELDIEELKTEQFEEQEKRLIEIVQSVQDAIDARVEADMEQALEAKDY